MIHPKARELAMFVYKVEEHKKEDVLQLDHKFINFFTESTFTAMRLQVIAHTIASLGMQTANIVQGPAIAKLPYVPALLHTMVQNLSELITKTLMDKSVAPIVNATVIFKRSRTRPASRSRRS